MNGSSIWYTVNDTPATTLNGPQSQTLVVIIIVVSVSLMLIGAYLMKD